MKIAIIGTGSVGRALGKGWAKQGYRILYGSRSPGQESVQRLVHETGQDASAATIPEAASAGEVVTLAIPWGSAEEIARSVPEWGGKILVDCTNPLKPGLQLALGTTTSGAEQISAWAQDARVVKAFNTTGWENMLDPLYGPQAATMFLCGNDSSAKATVTGLAEALGFEAIDAGPLQMARALEPLAVLWIQLASNQGLGRDIAFKILRR